MPDSIVQRDIHSFGFSRLGKVLASGSLVSESAASLLKAVNGAIIAIAFTPAVSAAHEIPLWRGGVAVGVSLFFWTILYLLLFMLVHLFDFPPLVRLLEST